MVDALAPGLAATWSDGALSVSRDTRPSGPVVVVERRAGAVHLRHRFAPDDLRDSLALRIAAEAAPETNDEFERMLVGVVRTTIADPIAAWSSYYRNSMHDLETGAADFAPVHATAEELVVGASLLDLGSCFGFFPLRMAARAVAVTATDLCVGSMILLAEMSDELRIPLETVAVDASNTELPDDYADTVTVLHLLEHLPAETGAAVVDEALRLARQRVVIAVPFEEVPDVRYGHVRSFTLDALRDLMAGRGLRFRVFEHHGGWLVIDPRP